MYETRFEHNESTFLQSYGDVCTNKDHDVHVPNPFKCKIMQIS